MQVSDRRKDILAFTFILAIGILSVWFLSWFAIGGWAAVHYENRPLITVLGWFTFPAAWFIAVNLLTFVVLPRSVELSRYVFIARCSILALYSTTMIVGMSLHFDKATLQSRLAAFDLIRTECQKDKTLQNCPAAMKKYEELLSEERERRHSRAKDLIDTMTSSQ